MSLLDTLRNALRSISSRHSNPDPDPTVAPIAVADLSMTVADAHDVIDEALLDPVLRIALEQQAARQDREKIREFLQSRERVAAVVEKETEILLRLGATRAWCDAFFRDLELVEKLPAELLETYPADQLYQNLEKLRLVLALIRRNEVMNRLAQTGAAAGPASAAVPAAPGTRGMSTHRLVLAGAAHATLGVGLIIGNFSGFAALLFTAPFVAPATTVSYGIGGMACGRAYVRLTEAIGL